MPYFIMKTIQELLTEVTEKTREINENYPELQKYLDETRITLPKGGDNPEIDKQELQNYLDSLNNMIEKYKK